MSETYSLSLRVPKFLIEKADSLVDSVGKDDNLRAASVRVKRSQVLRIAITKGLEIMATEMERRTDLKSS